MRQSLTCPRRALLPQTTERAGNAEISVIGPPQYEEHAEQPRSADNSSGSDVSACEAPWGIAVALMLVGDLLLRFCDHAMEAAGFGHLRVAQVRVEPVPMKLLSCRRMVLRFARDAVMGCLRSNCPSLWGGARSI